jgi:hypothetical protein
MTTPKLILLREWGAIQYPTKQPSDYTLRKMAREGLILPPPVKRGKHWYVAEHARDAAIPAASVADRLARDLAAA